MALTISSFKDMQFKKQEEGVLPAHSATEYVPTAFSPGTEIPPLKPDSRYR
jgi:hypothetical protein